MTGSVDHERPDPYQIRTRDDFVAGLRRLKGETGHSVRELATQLERAAEDAGDGTARPRVAPPPRSGTLGDWFAGRTLPQPASRIHFERLLNLLGVPGQEEIEAWWAAWRRARKGRPVGEAEPYRGLRSFNDEDAEWFFGRDRLRTELLDMTERLRVDGGGILLVVGASGSGKTSLVNAGLVASLRDGGLPGSAAWPVLQLAVTQHPCVELARSLSTELGEDAVKVERILQEDPQRCGELTRRVSARAADAEHVVIVVDQLEQTFAACPDEVEIDRFVAALCAAGTAGGALVILGLRADFYGRVLSHPDLARAVRGRQITVEPMTEDELREVLTQPARKAELDVEPALIERLLGDAGIRGRRAGHEVGTLPLISHALYTTWEKRQQGNLTLETYLALGGLEGAVAESANIVYRELPPLQQALARRMFLSLVQVNVGTADTRRRLPLTELFAKFGSDIEDVLDRFVEQRLVVVDADAVEITHDALLTAWPQMRHWLAEGRDGLVIAQQLDAAADAWRQEDRDRSGLIQGTRLSAAKAWAAANPDDVPPPTAEFLSASMRETLRSSRRRTSAVVALTISLLCAIVAAAVALVQRDLARDAQTTAEVERNNAQSRMVATRANQLRARDPSLARQLSLAAYQIAPTVEARSSLLDATAVRPAIRMGTGDSNRIMSAITYSPDGRTLVAAADDVIERWDVTTYGHPRRLDRLTSGTASRISALAFTPDGLLLAAAAADGTIRLWDLRDLTRPRPVGEPVPAFGGKAHAVTFSPDGRLLAAAGASAKAEDGGTARIWTVADNGSLTPVGQPLSVGNGAGKSVSFHRSNQFLAIGTEAGSVGVWDVRNPANPVLAATPADGPTKAVGQLAFSPDGNILAAGSADFTAYLWTTTDPRTPRRLGMPLTGATSWINAVTFSPDSAQVAVASSDTALGVRIVDIRSSRTIATLPHPAPVTAVKFSPDGRTVATSANDGVARIWPIPGPVLAMPYTVSAARFSPDDRTLAVGSAGTALIDVTDPTWPKPSATTLASPDGFSSSVSYTPDGNLLAVAHGRSGTVQLWNVTDSAHAIAVGQPLQAHSKQIEAMTFNPSGQLLATGSRDETVRIWDLHDPASPRLVATLDGFTGYVYGVAFSPDGRLLAAASADKTIRMWDISNLSAIASVGNPAITLDHYAYFATFSPDGRTLAAGGGDSAVHLFDLADPAHPTPIGTPLQGPTDYLYNAVFTPDGGTLAVAVTDGTVRLWDVRDPDKPKLTATLTAPTGAVYTLDYQAQGDLLAAGGAGNTTWLWHTDPRNAAAMVCATVGDAITPQEWRQYVPDWPYRPTC
ncbi:AAA family ATPase [Micromonospora sp. NPDC048947]|uniref:nSTAND1 domain-containing NTPase n=1 Tax=Micromonospora sp. NPDC048947 TaxID=3154826 RepID=UPI0033C55058